MNDALKELFNAYKHLPVGVMFFKHKKLFFVNDHIRVVLLLSNLTNEHIVDVIGETLNIENPSDEILFHFFSEHECFTYQDHIVQVEHAYSEDEIDIFVAVRISDQTIATVDSTKSLRTLKKVNVSAVTNVQSDEHLLLRRALGQWEKVRFASVVLYKGIPIRGESFIVEAANGKICLRVEKKQLIAAHKGVEWLIGARKDAMLIGRLREYDLREETVWLENLQIVSEGFHLRQVIRYECGENDRMNFHYDGRHYALHLHDISEKGVSIETDESAVLVALSSSAKTFDAELFLDGNRIVVRAVWHYTKALENDSMMKAVFKISYDSKEGGALHDWMNAKQLRIIKEVQNFVRMSPAPKRAEQHGDWVI